MVPTCCILPCGTAYRVLAAVLAYLFLKKRGKANKTLMEMDGVGNLVEIDKIEIWLEPSSDT